MERSDSHLASLFLILMFTVALPAGADGPPMPANPGEFYISGNVSRVDFKTPDVEGILQYVDDSILNAEGEVTATNPRGYMIIGDTESQENVPGLALGYAFQPITDGMFQGLIPRIEFSAQAYEREMSSYLATRTPATSGYFLSDGTETGLAMALFAIDGSLAPNGEDRGFMASDFALNDIVFEYEERFGSIEGMAYLDRTHNRWKISQGVGFSYSRMETKAHESFFFDDYLLVLDTNDTAGGDTSYTYDYDLTGNYIGAKLASSAGYDLFKGFNIFIDMNMTPMLVFADLEGQQTGLCLSTCDIRDPDNYDFSRGEIEIDDDSTFLALDAKASLGLSWRLWKLMVSAQGGVDYFTGYLRPETRDNGSIKLERESGMSYFAKANAYIFF